MTAPDDTQPVDPAAPASAAPPASATPAAPAAPEARPEAQTGGPGETAEALLESAAEVAIGAAVAPFTGGETVGIVASLTEAIEGGVDRLTHLGRHGSAAKPAEGQTSEAGEAESSEPTDPPA